MDFDAIMRMDWLASCYAIIEPSKGRKANIVANALSCQSMGILAHVVVGKRELARELHQLACLVNQLVDSDDCGVVLQNTSKSSITAEVKERSYEDPKFVDLRERVLQQKKPLLERKEEGVLSYRGRLSVFRM
uniref:Uncharacterized protein LOC104213718 n=1 Tax=Nicotiana sylvestris TaxID=4096 RepID=A0A1U7UZX4_NICSY|nr:PREDICTED: uncharacterized protein LOC104213718 [Nicotiana sylvestris]